MKTASLPNDTVKLLRLSSKRGISEAIKNTFIFYSVYFDNYGIKKFSQSFHRYIDVKNIAECKSGSAVMVRSVSVD